MKVIPARVDLGEVIKTGQWEGLGMMGAMATQSPPPNLPESVPVFVDVAVVVVVVVVVAVVVVVVVVVVAVVVVVVA